MPRGKTAASPEQQVAGLVATLDPKSQALVRSARKALRRRFPAANELVYDYPDNLMLAYSPTEGGIDAVVSISAATKGVRLVFTYGAGLPDPHELLQGTGRQNRFIPLASAALLRRPEVEALLAAAVRKARVKLGRSGSGALIVKQGSSKNRFRKRPAKR
jgi:hypothetical protein